MQSRSSRLAHEFSKSTLEPWTYLETFVVVRSAETPGTTSDRLVGGQTAACEFMMELGLVSRRFIRALCKDSSLLRESNQNLLALFTIRTWTSIAPISRKLREYSSSALIPWEVPSGGPHPPHAKDASNCNSATRQTTTMTSGWSGRSTPRRQPGASTVTYCQCRLSRLGCRSSGMSPLMNNV